MPSKQPSTFQQLLHRAHRLHFNRGHSVEATTQHPYFSTHYITFGEIYYPVIATIPRAFERIILSSSHQTNLAEILPRSRCANRVHLPLESYPSYQPTSTPSMRPSFQPVDQPTLQPSTQPITEPTIQPSPQPKHIPSSQPIEIAIAVAHRTTINPTNTLPIFSTFNAANWYSK